MGNSKSIEFHLETQPFLEHKLIKGVNFPPYISFKQLLITGPPGAGKSTFISKIGGWPDEGYVDLSLDKWWATKALSLRPRELHLGFPCQGYKDALAVFDEEWSQSLTPPELDFTRIRLPPGRRSLLSVNWRKRYVFEFIIPPTDRLFEQRSRRKIENGRHHVDTDLTMDQVVNQVSIYRMAALHLHQHNLSVYVREGSDRDPLQIVNSDTN